MDEPEIKREKGDQLLFRLALFLVPRLVTLYFRLVDLTSRKIWLNREYEQQICKKRPFNCACFHGTMLFPIWHCRQYPGVIMVSRSWDGEVIDRCLKRMGFDTTRGSSSTGGKEALVEMIEMAKERNYCTGLAVDAPRGPSRKAKMGIVVVGKETGQPVLPLMSWATRQIQFKSWDKMILPLPFCTIVMAFGKPTEVPPVLSNDDHERIRQEIEDNMLLAQKEAEERVADLKRGG